jgi:hypothetical protein
MLSQRDRSLIVNSISQSTGGVLRYPRAPVSCSRQNASGSVAAALRGEQRANPPAASRFASCKALRSATGIVRSLPGLVVGAGNVLSYRTRAFSWSFSSLVPNSRSSRSAISCQVRPAAFISLSTVRAWARERSV